MHPAFPLQARRFGRLAAVAALATLGAPLAGWSAEAPATTTQSTPIVMTPFDVIEGKDNGFQSANMGSGSRLALELKDAPVAYSVINRELIDALGINDLKEAAAWSTGNTFYATDNGGDSQGATSQYQSRGNVTSQGQTNGFGNQRNFYQNASISSDSYSVESYDFGRGPNAALFGQGAGTGGDSGNGGLSGVASVQTKRARFDGRKTTLSLQIGQYNYHRATLDVNQPLTDKLGLRINVVDLSRDDWRMLDMQANRGLSIAATYKVGATSELRLDANNEKRQSHTAGPGWFEFVSGWDGTTVFRGPMTNSMRSTNGTPGLTSVANSSYGSIQALGTTGLVFNGEDQGVDRLGQTLLYNPYDGSVMNYQNFAITRRADSTTRVPIWSTQAPNGKFFQRATLPVQGNGALQPDFGVGSTWYTKSALPNDMFHNVYEHSRITHLPSERFSATVDIPLIEQISRDIQLTWTQRLSPKLSVEVGGDANRNFTTNRNLDDARPFGGRTAYIDLSMIRPDGSPNAHFLEGYTTVPMIQSLNTTEDRTMRANAAYVEDLGRWGNYTLNLQGSLSERKSKSNAYVMSVKRNADPRLWNAAADSLRLTSYFDDPVRAWKEPSQVNFTDVVWDNNNNSPVVSPTVAARPSWVINTWSNTFIRTNYALLQTTARWFGNRVIFTGAYRRDLRVGIVHNSLDRGDIPATWDSSTLYFKPDAPADYFSMTYVQKNATTGLPVTGKPILAVTRPRTTVNGISIRDPLYINDRFRGDYNTPKSKSYAPTKSLGGVWHVRPWLSTSVNWSNTYTPSTGTTLDMTGEIRDALTAKGMDYSVSTSFLKDKVTLKWNYFVNTRQNDNYTNGANGNINALYQANKYDDPDTTSSGRNVRGVPDLPGNDYQDRRNFGYEIEASANLKGLRLTLNGSVSSFSVSNQGRVIRSYVPENAGLFKQVLEDAGGILDTGTPNPNAAHAPGFAKLDPSKVGATADQTAAVNAYNNIWANYELLNYNTRYLRTPNQPTANFFADYTIPDGKLRGLRLGAGIQWQGRVVIANQNLDTIPDPNATVPTAIDNPNRSQFTYLYGKGASNTQANIGYTFNMAGGDQLGLTLRVNNIFNDRTMAIGDVGLFAGVGYQSVNGTASGNGPRATLGMMNPARETVGSLVARFTPPINAQLTATYTFAGKRR